MGIQKTHHTTSKIIKDNSQFNYLYAILLDRNVLENNCEPCIYISCKMESNESEKIDEQPHTTLIRKFQIRVVKFLFVACTYKNISQTLVRSLPVCNMSYRKYVVQNLNSARLQQDLRSSKQCLGKFLSNETRYCVVW
jgi:hypothetical protein